MLANYKQFGENSEISKFWVSGGGNIISRTRPPRHQGQHQFGTSNRSICLELQKLERLEEETDQLVHMLKTKLDGISLLEESQVEMVDFQVRRHTKNLSRILEIEVPAPHSHPNPDIPAIHIT